MNLYGILYIQKEYGILNMYDITFRFPHKKKPEIKVDNYLEKAPL
jgi:hypothetical protein